MTDQPQVLEAGQYCARSAPESRAPGRGAPPADGLTLRIRQVVATLLDIDPDRLSRSDHLVHDLCVDSLAATELTLVLEDEFDISILDEERAPVLTYADIEDIVIRKVQGRSHT
jgi:acyl carrier protein